MPSGYIVSGRGDLDALFALRVSAQRADVGYKVANVDLSNRYEQIGASTPIVATGFKTGGTDLASLFKGQAVAPPTITINDVNFKSYFPDFVRYRLKSNGEIEIVQDGVNAFYAYWVYPQSGAPGPYRVRATRLSSSPGGVLTGSGLNTWLALTTTREWTLTRSTSGYASEQLLIEIDAGDGAVIDNATIYMEVLA